MRSLALVLLAACSVEDAGLGAVAMRDAQVDARVRDAAREDAPAIDAPPPRDVGGSDAPGEPDASDVCSMETVLFVENFEVDALGDLGWAATTEMAPFEARLSEVSADGPGADGGRYLLLATTDSNTSSAESGSATSSWVPIPPCAGGSVRASVSAVAGDIDFVRDSEVLELRVESREGGEIGSISFADQNDRDIGRPDALLDSHRLLETTDWMAYEESWPVPGVTREIRVSVYSWITHWDDFGGVDQLVVTFLPDS